MRTDLPLLTNPVNPDNPLVFLDVAIGDERGIKEFTHIFFPLQIKITTQLEKQLHSVLHLQCTPIYVYLSYSILFLHFAFAYNLISWSHGD